MSVVGSWRVDEDSEKAGSFDAVTEVMVTRFVKARSRTDAMRLTEENECEGESGSTLVSE